MAFRRTILAMRQWTPRGEGNAASKLFDDDLKASMSKKRVLLVDDNAVIRRAIRVVFDSHPKFEVCGEAEHGREAIERAPILRPDLIILDLSMPEMNGLEAAPILIQILPDVCLILFTLYDVPELRRLSRSAGIHAVVSKSKAATHLVAEAEALVARPAA